MTKKIAVLASDEGFSENIPLLLNIISDLILAEFDIYCLPKRKVSVIIEKHAIKFGKKIHTFSHKSQINAILFANAFIYDSIIKVAEFALEKNLPIFAIPGNPLNFSSRGVNFLIKTQNAVLVENAEDIICSLL